MKAIKGILHFPMFDLNPTDVPISAGSFRYADLLIRRQRGGCDLTLFVFPIS
jgi:hypothetical protein